MFRVLIVLLTVAGAALADPDPPAIPDPSPVRFHLEDDLAARFAALGEWAHTTQFLCGVSLSRFEKLTWKRSSGAQGTCEITALYTRKESPRLTPAQVQAAVKEEQRKGPIETKILGRLRGQNRVHRPLLSLRLSSIRAWHVDLESESTVYEVIWTATVTSRYTRGDVDLRLKKHGKEAIRQCADRALKLLARAHRFPRTAPPHEPATPKGQTKSGLSGGILTLPVTTPLSD